MFASTVAILKTKFVSDVDQCWRWTSMRAMALNIAFLSSWMMMPADLKTYLPAWLMPAIASGVLVIGMLGRVLKQKGPDNVESPPAP